MESSGSGSMRRALQEKYCARPKLFPPPPSNLDIILLDVGYTVAWYSAYESFQWNLKQSFISCITRSKHTRIAEGIAIRVKYYMKKKALAPDDPTDKDKKEKDATEKNMNKEWYKLCKMECVFDALCNMFDMYQGEERVCMALQSFVSDFMQSLLIDLLSCNVKGEGLSREQVHAFSQLGKREKARDICMQWAALAHLRHERNAIGHHISAYFSPIVATIVVEHIASNAALLNVNTEFVQAFKDVALICQTFVVSLWRLWRKEDVKEDVRRIFLDYVDDDEWIKGFADEDSG